MQSAHRRLAASACWLGLSLNVLAFRAANIFAAPPTPHNPFSQFDLPDVWEARFWADPGVKALRLLDARALADLVPVQSGIRFCRCPACDASEADDPLTWSVARPQVVTCRRCGVVVPNDTFPAKVDKKVPEEAVEVLPHVIHHYPYHAVEPDKQRYPEERLYLAAKRDYEAREFLAKTALYAAVRYHEQPPNQKDPALARMACVLVLRFAQVYPAYATHYDQSGQPKYLQPADLPPPYRRGYRTGKWDWTASLDVPLNLVIAYALVRDDPALTESGRRLGDPHPARTIEHDLFRASAEFVRLQPEEFSEMSLHAYRGLLAVGRLLDDPALIREARKRLDGFAERGFYHDGFWRQGDAPAHRRVLGLIDGWINRLLSDDPGVPDRDPARDDRQPGSVPGGTEVPMLSLARDAGSTVLTDPRAPEIQQASWLSPTPSTARRRPVLLGGVGLARLAVGQGAAALDLELRGNDNLGAPHFQRQALRLAVGGRPVLGDLDDLPTTATGWDRATASHNTVVVDGLNQRETPGRADEPALGGDFLFFAADPDFQVATLEDPRAYPQSTTRYRQTIVAASGARTAFAVSVFEIHGGLQHDQIFHAAPGTPVRWHASIPMAPGPATLLPPSIPYVTSARVEDGRWFVQAYGEFTSLAQGRVTRPAMAWLAGTDAPDDVRLHLLGDVPATLITAVSPDPVASTAEGVGNAPGRAGLILRRRSDDGATLKSTFVTVFEPIGAGAPFPRVGRVVSSAEVVVVYLETAEGREHVVVNLTPGTARKVQLADGRHLATDGLAVRVSDRGLVLAGGTFAEMSDGRQVRQEPATGIIRGVVRQLSGPSRGWFESDASIPDASALAGRVLLVRHGDGTVRGWTLHEVQNIDRGARLFVREEPGFELEPGRDGEARYYQFPRTSMPGPHRFRIARIARSSEPGK